MKKKKILLGSGQTGWRLLQTLWRLFAVDITCIRDTECCTVTRQSTSRLLSGGWLYLRWRCPLKVMCIAEALLVRAKSWRLLVACKNYCDSCAWQLKSHCWLTELPTCAHKNSSYFYMEHLPCVLSFTSAISRISLDFDVTNMWQQLNISQYNMVPVPLRQINGKDLPFVGCTAHFTFRNSCLKQFTTEGERGGGRARRRNQIFDRHSHRPNRPTWQVW